MTAQLYRRRAGEPVEVWRVGDGEPPEWVLHCLRTFFDPGDTEGSLAACVDRYRGLLLIEKLWPPQSDDVLARDYEPLPAQLTAAQQQIAALREALTTFRNYGCPVCHGDCASANPPVHVCPMQEVRAALAQTEGAEG